MPTIQTRASNSVLIETNCACGMMVSSSGAPGRIACPACGNVVGFVCAACGSVRTGGHVGEGCEACGSRAATRSGKTTRAKSSHTRTSSAKRSKKKPLSPLDIEGVCDVLTGAPLAAGDSLHQCHKCTAITRETSLREIKKHYQSRCPSCHAANSYRPVEVTAAQRPKAVFREIATARPSGTRPGEKRLRVAAVESHPPTRAVLIRLHDASGEAIPALITSGHVRKFGGVKSLKQWTGKQVLCHGVRAYVPKWGEVRMVRSTEDLKEAAA
jgi:hypothetical protein